MATPLVSRLRDGLREIVVALRRQYLNRVWQMDLGEGTVISFSARLDKTNPRGIHIGKYTVVTFGAAILTHDYVNRPIATCISATTASSARIRSSCPASRSETAASWRPPASSPATCPQDRWSRATPRE